LSNSQCLTLPAQQQSSSSNHKCNKKTLKSSSHKSSPIFDMNKGTSHKAIKYLQAKTILS
jgi:hypothetical protein